ncbi:uncharacterized protein LOC135847740 [Planococcus citri]|uniref:uncharacterized protein LOC135847740 n=1 Tax=Planococcus citri TaxID=170843 RepID=UPI0031F800D6
MKMKTCLFFVVLIVCSKYGHSKNLDKTGSTSSTKNASTPISSSPKPSQKPSPTINTTPTQTTTSASIPDEVPALQSSEFKDFSITPDIIVKTPNINSSFVDLLSEQIQTVLKHFQDPDPIGIPGSDILPDPMAADNVSASMVVATGFFYNITVGGLNKFSINVVDTYLDKMEVFVILKLKTVIALGNYTMSSLLVDNAGPFNITFTNVTAAGTVNLASDAEGKLYGNKSSIDIAYEDIEVELTNVASLVKPFLNTGGSRVFDAEKPLILENVNKRLIAEINRRLEFFPKIPPLTKLSPVDLAILEARRFVRDRYEPFTIDKIFDFDNSFLNVHVGPISISGLSRFARVGNITLAMVNQTVDLRIRLITQKLTGTCKWYYDIGKVGVTRDGQSNFSVDHLQFEARVFQPVDSRKSPTLEELEIETGPVSVKMDGQGSFDYLVEIVSKVLPKMIRHLIIDFLEETVKEKIQTDVLDKINVQQVYEQNLSEIKKYISNKI